MKKLIITLSSIALVLFGVYSCKKDNISGDKNNLIGGSILTLTKKINGNLDFSKPTATVSIQVGSKGAAVTSVNVYLATGSDALDKTKWKLIKNLPFTDGMTLSASTAEIAAALAPASITPGNQYVLQNEVVTADGRKFNAVNTPSNFTSFAVYNIIFSWNATAVCAFDQAASIGTYKVVYDGDWVDFATGDLITISAGPDASSIQFLAYPSLAAGGVGRLPWIVKVDAATGAATMTTQAAGSYGSVPAKVAATGFVFSCTGFINLLVDVTYGTDLYSGNKFKLQKQ
jgi:hypothetical protein